MEVVNPSVMVSRLDLVVLDSAAAGIDFCRLPQGFWNIGVFIEQRGGLGGTLGAPPRCNQGPFPSFWPIKIIVKFRGIWTPFDIDFLRCKKMKKIGTSIGHYVNRLVPKNDIKLLQDDYKTSKIDNITTWNNQKLQIRWRRISIPKLNSCSSSSR